MRSQAITIGLGMLAMCAAMEARGEDKVHELKAAPTTVHRGFFDASLKPVLTIDSGDIVRLWTTTGNPRYFESLGVPKEKIPSELYAAFEGAPGEGRDDHTLDGPIAVAPPRIERPAYEKPGPSLTYSTVGSHESALDPFSAYAKGESLLRRQLKALSAWHLVNIVLAYELTDEPAESLRQRHPESLIELIVSGVRERQHEHQEAFGR